MKLTIGASRIRHLIESLPNEEAIDLVCLLWPDLPVRVAELLVKHPNETRINGSQLGLPDSWDTIYS